MIKLATQELQYIAIFESLTGAIAKDCLINDNGQKVTFVVKKGNIGLAIGKGGNNIRKVRETIGKSIEIIEYSEEPEIFLSNLLSSVKIRNIKINEKENGGKIALIYVMSKDKGAAIGKEGKKIQQVKALAKRHHEIDDVKIL